jgi:hypothetical protein
MPIKRLDNILIVVDDLETVKAFFIELGLTLEGETTVEGPQVGQLIGLDDVRATLAMLRTPDGQGVESDKFHTPTPVRFGPVGRPCHNRGLAELAGTCDGPYDVGIPSPSAVVSQECTHVYILQIT